MNDLFLMVTGLLRREIMLIHLVQLFLTYLTRQIPQVLHRYRKATCAISDTDWVKLCECDWMNIAKSLFPRCIWLSWFSEVSVLYWKRITIWLKSQDVMISIESLTNRLIVLLLHALLASSRDLRCIISNPVKQNERRAVQKVQSRFKSKRRVWSGMTWLQTRSLNRSAWDLFKSVNIKKKKRGGEMKIRNNHLGLKSCLCGDKTCL